MLVGTGHGNPAHLKVASLFNLTDVGAHEGALESELAEEMDDAREERDSDELSEIMDSGLEVRDEPESDCTDGRRAPAMWYASRPW
jgi:hypothetical protein